MIPEQLKNCRFCKILYKKKKPYELEWQKKGYTYDEISAWLLCRKENYGVITGHDSLGGFDDDTEDNELMELYAKHFPKTFRVRDHNYIYLKGWNGKKITFYKEGKKCGELQGKSNCLVAPGSVHPSGAVYEVVNDLPIVTIEFEKFKKVFKKYMKEETTQPVQISNWQGDDINNIPITNIFNSDLDKCPSCGCATGTNFKIYPETNSYFCFHAHSGGGVWEAIAISEGIKSCSDIGRSCLSESEKESVLNVAYDKYHLKKPEMQQIEPRGWALSINIRKIAEKRNMLICPKCSMAFQFNETLGWYKCGCSKGGIKKFMALCLEGVKQ